VGSRASKKLIAILFGTAGIVAMAGPVLAQALPPVSNPFAPTPDAVALVIDASSFTSATLAEQKTCNVEVPDGSVVAQVLDAATESGCMAGWTWAYFPGFTDAGRFVTGLDGRESTSSVLLFNDWAVEQNYWVYSVNGTSASAGVDFQPVHDGDRVTFTFCDQYCYGPSLP
jgi:hypothetical protein